MRSASKTRFKIGDKVRYLGGSSTPSIKRNVKIGEVGVVTKHQGGTHDHLVLVLWDSVKKNKTHPMSTGECGTELHVIELATIHDSKLARNLYKNQIDKIEDGLIYLK